MSGPRYVAFALLAAVLAGCGEDDPAPAAKARLQAASKAVRRQAPRLRAQALKVDGQLGAEAQTTRQGSDLSASANYPYHCDRRWVPGYQGEPGAFGPGGRQEYTAQLIGASTCSVWQVGPRGQVERTHFVPGTGTVTRARIKSGPNPAPVSIATVRQYTGRDQQGNLVTTCCYGISQTAVVNPTPGGVTEIPVGLRVEAKPYDPDVPGEVGWHDVVAVNVHGTTGTLPLSVSNGPKPLIAPDGDAGALWFFPKFDPSAPNQNLWSASGFEVLMNYDWQAG